MKLIDQVIDVIRKKHYSIGLTGTLFHCRFMSSRNFGAVVDCVNFLSWFERWERC
jgi:hypothetical protein